MYNREPFSLSQLSSAHAQPNEPGYPAKDYLDCQLIPDLILPVQYYAKLQPAFSAEAEGRLLFAVLQDAIDCYIVNMNRGGRTAREEFREVRNWFNARNHRGLFAFETICELFGLDPGCIRKALRALRDESRAGAAGGPTARTAGPIARIAAPAARRAAGAKLKRRGLRRVDA